MATSLVGSQLSKYQILSEIGRGGMGVVYQALDPLLDRMVAIKVLAPHLVWETGFVERFLREARAAARLKHPNIVTIYDVGQDRDWFFFVMEYLEGSTLGEYLRREGPLSPQQMLSILDPLGNALDYAHSHGLVHRDVKPGNVIVGPGGQVALTDFGIAKAAQETRLTVTGTIMGTPEYMSPEQALGKEVDYRTDLYSLAILGFEMLCGAAPFTGTTPHAVVYKQIHEPMPPISRVRPELPAVVEEVMERALAKEPDDRYGTASAFVSALDKALASRDAAPAEEPRHPGSEPILRPKREPTAEGVAPAPASPSVEPLPVSLALEPEEAPTQLSQEGQPGSAAVAVAARPPAPTPVQAAARRADRRKRHIPRIFWILGGLAVILIAGGIALLSLGGDGVATPTAVAEVSQHATPKPASTSRPRATSTLAPAAPPPTEPVAAPMPECNDPAGCVLVGPGEPVRIAALLALSGPNGSLGANELQGIEMAIADRRHLLDHPIELMPTDSQCDTDIAQAVAMELASAPEILAVIGPSCSNAVEPAARMLCVVPKPLISPSSTAPELTADDRPGALGCFLRTTGPDLLPPRELARFAVSSGIQRAAAIHDGNAYSETMQRTFVREFEAMGGNITAQEGLMPGGPDPGQLLEAIAGTEPQLLYYPVHWELAAHVTQVAREIPLLREVLLVGSHAMFTPSFLGASGEAAVGTLMVTMDVSTGAPGLRHFVLRFEEQHGGPPESPFHIFAYDAANMVFSAIETVAIQDDTGRLQIGRAALLEALFATRGFPGLSGPLTCSPSGSCSNNGVAVYKVLNSDPDSWNPGTGPDHNPRKIWP